jgi:hypothetical protein
MSSLNAMDEGRIGVATGNVDTAVKFPLELMEYANTAPATFFAPVLMYIY